MSATHEDATPEGIPRAIEEKLAGGKRLTLDELADHTAGVPRDAVLPLLGELVAQGALVREVEGDKVLYRLGRD